MTPVTSQPLQMKKEKFLKALDDSYGIISTACKRFGISRRTFYNWCEDDPSFKDSANEIKEIAIDYVESQLMKKIKGGDTTSIIFYLKTKGKNRGWSERFEITGANGGPIETLDLSKLSDAELIAYKALITKAEVN